MLIEVKAAGMNFRDVLKALALYPGEAPDARIFGDEVGGIVTAVGAGRDARRAGRSRLRPRRVRPRRRRRWRAAAMCAAFPANLSFEEAATIAGGLHDFLARAQERGAHARRANVSSSTRARAASAWRRSRSRIISARKSSPRAGSATKRALLKTLGVKHVIDSRRGDFAEAVMELTDRRGVDVVLNALAGEAIPMGLSCLAEFGRFIEIGKRDIYQNSRIPLWPLRRNASFHVVAMDAVFSGDEALTREMLGEIAELVEQGALTPLPFRSFPACRIDAAFRLMAERQAHRQSRRRLSRKRLCRGAANRSHRRSQSSRMAAI